MCNATVLRSVGVCVCVRALFQYNSMGDFVISRLPLLALRFDHMRVELCDNNGDVVAVHAGQLLGQRQHFGQPLVVDGAKLVISHRVAHQVRRRILVLKR